MRRLKTTVLSLFLIVMTLTPTVFSAFFIRPAFALPALVLTAQPEKAFYYMGELVKILGTVTNTTGYPIQDAAIGIEVKDPNGNAIFIDGVWTQPNGYYEDSFRLPTESPIGKYTAYVTANKHGYTQTSKQTDFYASTQQLGNTIISIAGHEVRLETGNVVKGTLNVTMFSSTISATVISNRFLLITPEGRIVHDNFQGIGNPQDYERQTVYNNSLTTIAFQTTLTAPQLGYYSYLYALFDGTGTTQYASTAWIQGFLYTVPPVFIMSLGSLSPESAITNSLAVSLKRYEIAKFTLTLTQSIKSIQLNLGATSPSKFLLSMNNTNYITHTEMESPYTWELYNIPAGAYDILVTALSNTAPLSSISLLSGLAITGAVVSITDVEATSESATPSGAISYNVCTEWCISADDLLNVSAYLESTFSESEEISVSILSENKRDFYLTINVPSSPGTYSIIFRATLKTAGVQTDYPISLKVQSGVYNITIVNDVDYYRMPATWEWLLGARSPEPVDDSDGLSALSVTDIHVVDVGTGQNGNPVNVTVELKARNKAASWLSFGDGPHYELWIEDTHDPPPFQLGLLIAGESDETMKAVLKVDQNRRVDFKIRFKMSANAEFILLAEGVFETLISAYVSGWVGDAAQVLGDIAKLTALNYLKACTEAERGFMVRDDVPTFLSTLSFPTEVVSDIIVLVDNLIDKNKRNPWLALTSAFLDFMVDGRIDPLKFVEAGLRLIMWTAYRSASRFFKIVEYSFGKAQQMYSRSVSSLVTSWTSGTTTRIDWFFKKLGIVFSLVRLLKIVWDLWTMPQEEGKIVSSTVGTGLPVATFDPVVSISYNGPASNTTIDYFGDIYCMTANVSQLDGENATGMVNIIADPNMTSTYLSLVSQATFQRNLFKSLGLNATSSDLSWQEGSNSFSLEGNGTMYEGLQKSSLSLNSTWIQGALEMSADAVPIGPKALLNVSLLYPFGKNLSHTIQVTLPLGSTNISVLSPGSYTIQDNIITWNYPVDSITVEFTPPLAHDISIKEVTPARTVVGQGFSTEMNLTLQNQGDYTENFNVTFYANATTIGTVTSITLGNGSSTTIIFTWNTTGFAYGNYTISAYAPPVEGETSTADNTLVDGCVFVTVPGDINGDQRVNVLDAILIANSFNSKPGDANWNPNADINGDNKVNILDCIVLANHFGQSWT